MPLRLDWASHDAVTYACTHWHYSKSVPAGKLVKVGVWEDDKFIGVILYSRGAASNIGSPFGLDQTQVCELTRVAMRRHESHVSRALAISLRMLKQLCPAMRLVVSFADTEQGHHGGIYQANGWWYIGDSASDSEYRIHGKKMHRKTVYSRYGNQSVPWLKANVDPHMVVVRTEPKHKYVKPLDAGMAKSLETMKLPYPKRAKQAMAEHHSAQRRGSTDLHAPTSDEAAHAV